MAKYGLSVLPEWLLTLLCDATTIKFNSVLNCVVSWKMFFLLFREKTGVSWMKMNNKKPNLACEISSEGHFVLFHLELEFKMFTVRPIVKYTS